MHYRDPTEDTTKKEQAAADHEFEQLAECGTELDGLELVLG
jgi:hypothetical protein